MADALDGLYARPLAAGRQGPLYNAFSYPTKISAESIALFVACHTRPGDTVLDVFGGSGSTGIAALLCERPTQRMTEMANQVGVSPQWGPRNAVLYELSEIGSLLANVMTHPPDPESFEKAAHHLIEAASSEAPGIYETQGPNGDRGEIRHVIWSDIVACPSCSDVTTFADVKVRYEPLRFGESHTCGACGYTGHPDSWRRVTETIADELTGAELTRRRRVPWRVYGRSGRQSWSRPAMPGDASAGLMSALPPLPSDTPIRPLHWGDLYRSGYHQGMTHLHHLYTARNFRVLAGIWALVDQAPKNLRDALRLFVLSYNASHSTLMTRVVLKQNSPDFVLTGAQSGVLYVSGLPVEKNIYAGLNRKIGVFRAAFDLLRGTTGTVEVVTASSAQLALPDQSIDYVFTDPPFGGYIPYSEINQINELWLGRTTSTSEEAIVSPAQGKGTTEYQLLLTKVFKEVARVLKPSREATLVFHSAHAAVWQALASSLNEAELSVSAASILDKTQASFKQVNGHVAVSGDPLLRVRRSADKTTRAHEPLQQELIGTESDTTSVKLSMKRRNERAYSEMVGQALLTGQRITVDARNFYLEQAGGGTQ